MKKTKAKVQVPLLKFEKINLDFGNMVVNVKKLKKGSSMNIHPTLGQTGIRG